MRIGTSRTSTYAPAAAIALAVAAVLVGIPTGAAVATTPAAATPAAVPTGTVVARLAPVAGHPSLAGIVISVSGYGAGPYFATATTDTGGTATFTDVPADGSGATVRIDAVPDAGTATFAKAASDVLPVAGGTTTASLPLAIGGTLVGTLVDHTGAPLAGVLVTAVPIGPLPNLSARTDASGRYVFTGVGTGAIQLLTPAIAATGATPSPGFRATWEARAFAQTATTAARTTTVPRVLVHSGYDLDATLVTARTWEPISGATIRARNTVTGLAYDERTPFVVRSQHDVQWQIPSGTYTLELITKATPSHPVEHWWFTDPDGTENLSQDASQAFAFPVTLGPDADETIAGAYLPR